MNLTCIVVVAERLLSVPDDNDSNLDIEISNNFYFFWLVRLGKDEKKVEYRDS